MALINCNECGKEISDKASSCPQCGSPVNASNVSNVRTLGFGLFLAIIVLPIIFVWFLLRKGHSTTQRIFGFAYLLVSMLIVPSILDGGSSETEAINESSYTQSASEKNSDGRPQAVDLNQFSAQEIADAYDKNTVAADQQFKGKWILISGLVDEINTDFTGDAYVTLSVENRFSSPQAKFVKDEMDRLAKLEKGQRIRAICIGNGDVIKTPMLEQCTFVN
ncbi:TPA: zinc-ribbon domain-containing protein [Escherichia coli]|nr:zinc-ribbon domain-containing protein [Escherichia coli]